MKNKSIILVLVAFAALIAGLFIYSKTQKGTVLKSVTISQPSQQLLNIGLYIAKDKGFFEKQGLALKIETAGGDAKAFLALTSGKANFALADPGLLAIAHEKGWDGRVIAMAVDRTALWEANLDQPVAPFTEIYAPLAFAGVMVSQKMIADDPKTVQKFVNAYEESFQFIQHNFDETIMIAKNNLPQLSQEVITTALIRLVSSGCISAHAKASKASWDKLVEAKIKQGGLKALPSKELINNSFADRAVHAYK